ncbi:MAG: pseudouridine synthase [Thermoprotei archaeon]|nr:MAG: pseudouridine synthase [Thermoprotei archaeon]RLF15831.1 MAG: pseudouridine synthase [Thermoprotei archaeon]
MTELSLLLGLRRVRAVADYQFGEGVGFRLFPEGIELKFSPKTGRVRHIYLDGVLLATLRPSDGLLALTVEGGRRLLTILTPPRLRVKVLEGVEEYVSEGRDVLAKHVSDADPELRPGEEVLVVDSHGELLAVGKAVLSGLEMLSFKEGVAVKVRRGIKD